MRSPKDLAQDDQVMATNNSSIVSKRSVERFYYPDEPHFFRYFVKKPLRRSPLINRGYHLRLHVIDVVVREFLKKPTPDGTTKVLVNLGCGSDVLPWQCLTRYREDCRGVKFVDVDFPDLIRRKRQTVLTTPELIDAFTSVEEVDGPSVVLKSDEYVQIGCDLRELKTLEEALSTIVDIPRCSFLFVAEVSITYMEREGADGVIQWASTLGNAQFCLLEQILPDGPRHPFAETMLAHFDKLNTPLKSVHVYPTLESQRERFTSRGWNSVDTWTLWQAWADSRFLTEEERRKLDAVEPFDEWEEFAIFGCHYCLVHASTSPPQSTDACGERLAPAPTQIPTERIRVQIPESSLKKIQRRFGASTTHTSPNGNTKGLCNFLGLGGSSRLQSFDIFSLHGEDPGACSFRNYADGPSSRMCYGITADGILVGGRTSPLSPLKDCWLLSASVYKLQDLPRPLYRHSVVSLGYAEPTGPSIPRALLIGGKEGPLAVFDGAYVFASSKTGWRSCKVAGEIPIPVSGAFCVTLPGKPGQDFRGIFGGGIRDDGVVTDQLLAWRLGHDLESSMPPVLTFSKLEVSPSLGNELAIRRVFARYGAACAGSIADFMLLGGIIKDCIIPGRDDMLRFRIAYDGNSGCQITHVSRLVDEEMLEGRGPPRPLLVGASVETIPESQIVIMGGGATCFSMGTFWNSSVYSFQISQRDSQTLQTDQTLPHDAEEKAPAWELWKTQELPAAQNPAPPPDLSPKAPPSKGEQGKLPKAIPCMKLDSAEDFLRVLRDRQPVVLSGSNIGPCTSTWDLESLVTKIGGDRMVVIHDSSTRNMDFVRKNFQYVTTSFRDFAARVEKEDMVYLRALSSDEPSDKPANLTADFPSLAAEFVLPPELGFVSDNLFSSVLRVSGPVNMWLHYDVMANVYCQIHGSKRMLLFPPSDVQHLAFRPGASSSNLDVFDSSDATAAALIQTDHREAVLHPGDILFLPPLWLHAGSPESAASIAVNVFFRDLDDKGGYAQGRDVYGNRDLAPYERGRQDVAKIARSFGKLPADAREFYLLRLADELKALMNG
ncbi:methyltransferase-like protein [Thozetella sp. PMI_491]|nr:methyltransferase-like protein [Thozetella sp. PMI_491]